MNYVFLQVNLSYSLYTILVIIVSDYIDHVFSVIFICNMPF